MEKVEELRRESTWDKKGKNLEKGEKNLRRRSEEGTKQNVGGKELLHLIRREEKSNTHQIKFPDTFTLVNYSQGMQLGREKEREEERSSYSTVSVSLVRARDQARERHS